MRLKNKGNFAAMDVGMPRSANEAKTALFASESVSRTSCAGARHLGDD